MQLGNMCKAHKAATEEDAFASVVAEVVSRGESELAVLEEMDKGRTGAFSGVATYFAFDPAKYSMEEFFADLCTLKSAYEVRPFRFIGLLLFQRAGLRRPNGRTGSGASSGRRRLRLPRRAGSRRRSGPRRPSCGRGSLLARVPPPSPFPDSPLLTASDFADANDKGLMAAMQEMIDQGASFSSGTPKRPRRRAAAGGGDRRALVRQRSRADFTEAQRLAVREPKVTPTPFLILKSNFRRICFRRRRPRASKGSARRARR